MCASAAPTVVLLSKPAKKLSEGVEIKTLRQTESSRRLQVSIKYRVPDPKKLAPFLLNWDPFRLNSLSPPDRKQLLDALDKRRKEGSSGDERRRRDLRVGQRRRRVAGISELGRGREDTDQPRSHQDRRSGCQAVKESIRRATRRYVRAVASDQEQNRPSAWLRASAISSRRSTSPIIWTLCNAAFFYR